MTTAVLALGLVGGGVSLPPAAADPTAAAVEVAFNENAEPAGTLRNGFLELELEIVEGTWRPLGAGRPGISILAFSERGGAPTNPGPLIRVTFGTTVQVRVSNPLDTAIVVHGFGSRRGSVLVPPTIPAHTTSEVRFVADAEGTYYYWGGIDGTSFSDRHADSQLNGAIVVDPAGQVSADRVLLISMWGSRRPDGTLNTDQEVLSINGRPWPNTERLTYAMGDSIRWRIVNASEAPHAMHLHGFYFRVDAFGDIARDAIYWQTARRMAVTQRIEPARTMSLVRSPDRPGGWIFHCHMAEHVIPNPTLAAGSDESGRVEALFTEGHHEADPDRHATEGMGGLLMGIYVRPPPGYVVNEPKRRELRLFIQSADVSGGTSGKRFSYILQEGPTPGGPLHRGGGDLRPRLPAEPAGRAAARVPNRRWRHARGTDGSGSPVRKNGEGPVG